MIERNRVAIVIKDGKVDRVLSSHPMLLDIVDLDKSDDDLISEIKNLEALEQLLHYQIDIN